MKRRLIPLAQNNATGIFKISITACMEMGTPTSSPARSASMANPVKPPDIIPAGRTSAWMAKL